MFWETRLVARTRIRSLHEESGMGQTRSTWATVKGLSGASAYPSPTDTLPAAVATVALCQGTKPLTR